VIFYVLASWAVTSLTRNSQDKIVFVVVIVGGLGTGVLEVGGMTLEAAGRNGAIEISRAVNISGTVDPAMEFAPIGDGKFE
jgi:hypothetical protein